MRILVLSPVLPYPPNWGFATRVYQFLRILSQRHEVTLVAYSEVAQGPDVDALRAICADVRLVPRTTTTAQKRLAQLTSLFSPTSFQWRSRHTPAMQRLLDEVTGGKRFDVIQIESSQLACFALDRSAAVLVDEHNIEYELLYRTYRTESSPVRRFYNWVEYAKFRREEIRAWRESDGVLTTSGRETRIIDAMGVAKSIRTIPNGVDTAYFAPSEEPVDRDAIVMTGLMKYRPNVDGAVYFVAEVLPKILASRPRVVFYIVGGEPPEEVRRLAGPNVVVTGTVPDVRPYVRKAAVFVVPLRMGGGTRLKVLEGLAMRKPMVSTSLGCEGIDVVHGEHLLIADDPAAFAADVLRMLDDPARSASLAAAGHGLVHRRYRWETIVEDLEAYYAQRLAGLRAPAAQAARGTPGAA
jgi:polysaccharide biosynthesis protein PslH